MTGTENKRSERVKTALEWAAILTVAVLFQTLLVTTYILVKETEYPVGGRLYLVYFAYCASVVITYHVVFFIINAELQVRGSKFRKKMPKFIEYTYAALISIGLLQVFFSSARVTDYLIWRIGEDNGTGWGMPIL